MSRPIRVLIVDDTRAVRAVISALLSTASDIEVIGEAADPYEARELIRALNPDVITLDVEMPRMDGLSFLERLMRLRPMPVVMVSSRTTENSEAAIRALALGAVDCVNVAQLRLGDEQCGHLVESVRAAATSTPHTPFAARRCSQMSRDVFQWNGKVVLIGASTGGVDALMTVLSAYPKDGPPTVIAQHMPKAFLESFTARLDRSCLPTVTPAHNGMRMEPGIVCVARGGEEHVAISKRDPLRIETPPITGTERYVPLVDTLFSSAEPHAASVVVALLTGMGRDGAEAMARLHAKSAHTIVQDADTSVVDGMPKAARTLNAAREVAALPDIGGRILANASRKLEVAT